MSWLAIQEKLFQHDQRFDSIDRRFVEHDHRFDSIDLRLAEHDHRFDSIDLRLAEHDQRFDTLVTRVEFHTAVDSIMTTLDGMTGILQRLDQERIFTGEWIRRIESDVDRIKKHLRLG